MKRKLICLKVCVELGKATPEEHEIFRTSFGDNTMGGTLIFSGFLDPNVENTAKGRERGGPSSIVSGDEKLQKVRKIVKERRSTISEITGRFGLSYGTCQGFPREALYVDGSQRPLCHASPPKRKRQRYL
jgi:hypothetical protein